MERFHKNVPETLKTLAELIGFRFCIDGECDAMYICNRIAHTAKIGDGKNNFWGTEIKNHTECAVALQSAYGWNIRKEDINELAAIIETANIDPGVAIEAMKYWVELRQLELKETPDEWRKPYLKTKIREMQKNIEKLEKGES